LAMEPYHA